MNEQDRQLVELITQQVLALLRKEGGPRGGTITSSPGSPVPHTAPINPPMGQCTGDYSKFPELAGKLYGNASPASLAVAAAALKAKGKSGADGGEATIDAGPMLGPRSAGVSGVPDAPTTPRILGVGENAPAPRPLPLTGIITANQLQEAIKASPDGVVWLAPQARLTPLANDFARQKKEQVRRGAPPEGSPAMPVQAVSGSPAPASQWLWWIEGGCPVVRDVTQSFGLALRPVAAGPTAGALPQVIRELARAVKTKQVAGGILFVPSAARAACMANRSSALRAVVGTGGEAVERGIRDIGANVLIIEYPHHGHRSTAAMLSRFTQQTPSAPPSVERELADLQRP